MQTLWHTQDWCIKEHCHIHKRPINQCCNVDMSYTFEFAIWPGHECVRSSGPTHSNASCHTFECIMSHAFECVVSHAYECVMSHVFDCIFDVFDVFDVFDCVLSHTSECVMPHTLEWVKSHAFECVMSNASCVTHERVTSHSVMSCLTYELVKSSSFK